MSKKRQQSKGRHSKCLTCGQNYDRNRFPGGCPNCARQRFNDLMKGIGKR